MNVLFRRENAVACGGDGSIGGAVIRAVAHEGAKVSLAGRTDAKLQGVVNEISPRWPAIVAPSWRTEKEVDSLNRIHGMRTDGEHTDVWVRATTGLRKVEGRWTITHEHYSVPFYMEPPYKASLDLKPELSSASSYRRRTIPHITFALIDAGADSRRGLLNESRFQRWLVRVRSHWAVAPRS